MHKNKVVRIMIFVHNVKPLLIFAFYLIFTLFLFSFAIHHPAPIHALVLFRMIRMCTARPFRAVDFYSIILFDCLSSLSFLFFHKNFPDVLRMHPTASEPSSAPSTFYTFCTMPLYYLC